MTYSYSGVDELVAQQDQPTAADAARRDRRRPNRVWLRPQRQSHGGGAPASPRNEPDGVTSDFTTTYEFDHRDELAEIRNPLGKRPSTPAATTARWSNPSRAAFENGAKGPITKRYPIEAYKYFTTRYAYDPNGDLASRSIPFAPNQSRQSDADLKKMAAHLSATPGSPTTITDARGNRLKRFLGHRRP